MADISNPSATEKMGGMFLPLGILAMIAMMVLPLPVFLLDVFFVFNILLSLLVLMVAINTYKPLDFSSFPSLLLIATTLRLALNVASTRIVLTDGHTGAGAAGKVIEAFGAFVIGGNFAVGIVVFIILMIINLVVITKGAGRVSEVSARFTLDAMPGKQMAIDADLNAGILKPEEARVRRKEVAEEADFYGAMDGASKFVKGDAVAGIMILAANILGGIIIGTTQYGLTAGTAAQTYVLLSIGDGLVAQIPSLLLSIATAIIVTRVSGEADMAEHITDQVNISRAWLPVAGVMGLLGLVPGMPNILFLLGASGAGLAFWYARGKEREDASEVAAGGENLPAIQGGDGAKPDSGTITAEEVTDYAPISIQIGFGLVSMIDSSTGGELLSRITGIRREVSQSMGFVVPGVRIRDDLNLPSNTYRIRIGQAIVAEDQVYPDRKLALQGGMSTKKLKGVDVKDPSFGMDATWIMPHQQAEAEADDHVVVEPDSVIATHLSQMLYQHAANLIGPDDVQGLLDRLAEVSPTLVESVVPKPVALHTITSVMRHLLSERIPVSDLRRILEGLADVASRLQDPQDMAEALRPALTPLLLQQIAPLNQNLPLITLTPDFEELLTRSYQQGAGLIVDQGLAQQMLQSLNQANEEMLSQGRQPVVIVSNALRRPFATFLRGHGSDAIVLAVNELPDNRKIEIVATVGGNRQIGQAPQN
ncbi:flagellar biosynthesis protein FlhA [Donghicola sp. XS_ASV15]|uniref:flagellar biosynthesis protein FlhA n=1 Tax=Donghicola sp. XS_ASV15 TaxID=3241295 RepID=UPI0035162B70